MAFDGKHFSEGAMRMAEWLNEKETILATGVFLSPIDYREVIGYSGMGIGTPVMLPPLDSDDELVNPTIARFKERCTKSGLEFRVHKDTDLFALQELINETRFADLLVISSELFYENIDKDQPNEYLKKTLHQSECPVMLVPEQFTLPDHILLAYDGKASSVFAIKQFAYIFPELSQLPTFLVTVEETEAGIPKNDFMSELASRHFPSLTIEPISGDKRETFRNWVNGRVSGLLVSGAFGRGEISSLFRKSFITDIIRQHKLPIFIAHR